MKRRAFLAMLGFAPAAAVARPAAAQPPFVFVRDELLISNASISVLRAADIRVATADHLLVKPNQISFSGGL